jgi:hypothetical protein
MSSIFDTIISARLKTTDSAPVRVSLRWAFHSDSAHRGSVVPQVFDFRVRRSHSQTFGIVYSTPDATGVNTVCVSQILSSFMQHRN